MEVPGSRGRPLRLLALDGGGVRGLVSLLILRRMMHRINQDNPPKPCDVFDVIAGTSTGGLIAIMLGRLGMDIDSAIDAYVSLSREVFVPRKRAKALGGRIWNVLGQATFDAKALERAIRNVVETNQPDKNADAPLYERTPAFCRIFVCAVLSNGATQRLRNYPVSTAEPTKCRIWEAARATSAAPTFFDPITFADGTVFRDGALRVNNPATQLVMEVEKEFPGQEVSTIVSLGTGLSAAIELGNGLVSVAKACSKIATDSDHISQEFIRTYCRPGGKYRDKFFRFDVKNGLQDVGLEEWQKVDRMNASTWAYLDDPKEEESLDMCVQNLRSSLGMDPVNCEGITRQPDAIIATARQPTYSHSFYQLDFIEKQRVSYFAPRSELSKIQDSLRVPNTEMKETQRVSLVGLGGSGKTQLMLQYASSARENYGVVLWLDASSMEALKDTLYIAASLLGLVLPPTLNQTTSSSALVRSQSNIRSHMDLIKKDLRRRGQPWLLLLDEADDPDMINELGPFLPSERGGHIIISSRQKEAHGLANHQIYVQSLSVDSARDLLLHHAGIGFPTELEHQQAVQIVGKLDHIPLAVDLAGNYIGQNLSNPGTYLHIYDTHEKRELVRRAIGKDAPRIANGYKMSVLTAWGISIAKMEPQVVRFLHLLCFLDPTSTTKDTFKRACTPKLFWDPEGRKKLLKPVSNHVPDWLLSLFCDAEGQWSELQFEETVGKLSASLFLRVEESMGIWYHHCGTVPSQHLTSDGSPVARLTIPQSLHDLGCFYHDEQTRRQYSYEAFSVIIHAFQNDIDKDGGMFQYPSPRTMLVGFGGAVGQRASLERQLEEAYGHILVLKDHAKKTYGSSGLCFNHNLPVLQRCEAIMFGSIFWPRTKYSPQIFTHEQMEARWKQVMHVSEEILGIGAGPRGSMFWRPTAGGGLEFIPESSSSAGKASSNLDGSYQHPTNDDEFRFTWASRHRKHHDYIFKRWGIAEDPTRDDSGDSEDSGDAKAERRPGFSASRSWKGIYFLDDPQQTWISRIQSTGVHLAAQAEDVYGDLDRCLESLSYHALDHSLDEIFLTWKQSEMAKNFALRIGEERNIDLLYRANM